LSGGTRLHDTLSHKMRRMECQWGELWIPPFANYAKDGAPGNLGARFRKKTICWRACGAAAGVVGPGNRVGRAQAVYSHSTVLGLYSFRGSLRKR